MGSEIHTWIDERKQNGFSKKEIYKSLLKAGYSKKESKFLLKEHFKRNYWKISIYTFFILLVVSQIIYIAYFNYVYSYSLEEFEKVPQKFSERTLEDIFFDLTPSTLELNSYNMKNLKIKNSVKKYEITQFMKEEFINLVSEIDNFEEQEYNKLNFLGYYDGTNAEVATYDVRNKVKIFRNIVQLNGLNYVFDGLMSGHITISLNNSEPFRVNSSSNLTLINTRLNEILNNKENIKVSENSSQGIFTYEYRDNNRFTSSWGNIYSKRKLLLPAQNVAEIISKAEIESDLEGIQEIEQLNYPLDSIDETIRLLYLIKKIYQPLVREEYTIHL